VLHHRCHAVHAGHEIHRAAGRFTILLGIIRFAMSPLCATPKGIKKREVDVAVATNRETNRRSRKD